MGYEEGEDWVVNNMTTGYPRFLIHKSICALVEDIILRYSTLEGEQKAIALPNRVAAQRCVDFIRARAPNADLLAVNLATHPRRRNVLRACVTVVIVPAAMFPVAKEYWQHTGDGISSRRAEFCHNLLREGLLLAQDLPPSDLSAPEIPRAPKRYQRRQWPTRAPLRLSQARMEASDDDSSRFLEEHYGRNLSLEFVARAKSAIKRRIAGVLLSETHMSLTTDHRHSLAPNCRGVGNLKEDDVYLFPCGMNAIFNAHRCLLSSRGNFKSVSWGFPYVDTLKILEKFGPGCYFYGHASSAEMEDLEQRIQGGEKILGLFCEFPGNPLLSCPDLVKLRHLADKHQFAIVVDETIGTFANINVLPYADIVVSSLTKTFSGDCNVMGGSAVLNPNSRFYPQLKKAMADEVLQPAERENYWPEDIVFLERNSRDFVSRVNRININADAICRVLMSSTLVNRIYYPKYNDTKPNYDKCRTCNGGYGGLLSVVFQKQKQAIAFYDALPTAKGPSLGTNFTLTSPYVLLAHYQELDWAKEFGVEPDLVRISVGLEDTGQLVSIFKKALEAAEKAVTMWMT